MLLLSCGDSTSTSSSDNENSKNDRVETIYNLGKCVSDRKGEVIFVEKEDAYYECDGTSWISDKDDSESGKSSTVQSSSSKDEEKEESSSSEDAKSSSSSEAASESDEKHSSSNDVDAGSCSSSEPQSSSSNDSSKEDSSSEALSSSSQNPTPVMSLGTYDCDKYVCAPTEHLNQDLLAKGEYGEVLDIRNKHVYNTIKIGEQTWMAQNLDFIYKIYQNGKRVIYENECYYDNDNCTEKGRYYTWAAAADSAAVYSTDMKGVGYGYALNFDVYKSWYIQQNPTGICPDGWHLATKRNYEDLFEYVGGAETAGLYLKSASGWMDRDYYGDYTDYGGENTYGLSMLQECVWTSTIGNTYPSKNAICMCILNNHEAVFSDISKYNLAPIRCMMNSPKEEDD
ncbi:FISUMP domain-containing protein [Fibrobacter sp. UWH9]|nr:FISUMP domain-containing protein [Fibrobacter sp. UWH9]